MKLGERLVEDGLITKDQLKASLERQVVFGGRLGTNLVELGILREHELTEALSKYLKIKAADKKEIDDASREALDVIDIDTATKYNIVPFRKEKKRLFVATFDAMKMEVMDELRFATGFDVVPHIVSEIRFMYAIEKHYGVRRDLRFISVIDSMQEDEAIKEVFAASNKKPAPKPKSAPSRAAPHTAPSQPAEASAPSKTKDAVGNEIWPESTQDKQPVAREERNQTEEAPPPTPSPVKAKAPVSKEQANADVREALVRINDKDEIAEILVREGSKVASRRVIFIVKGKRLEGWKSENVPAEGFAVTLDPTSLFSQVIENKNFYRGPMPQTAGNDIFSSILGGLPQDCVIIPVMIRERVVAVIYADNGNDNALTGNIHHLNGIASLASLAFEILILRTRILDTSLPSD